MPYKRMKSPLANTKDQLPGKDPNVGNKREEILSKLQNPTRKDATIVSLAIKVQNSKMVLPFEVKKGNYFTHSNGSFI